MAQQSSPQSRKRIIQLSGVTIEKDSLFVPGVHIYVPKAGRGTTSNGVGYFSMPVLPGDSVVISSLGFKRQTMIVPNSISDFVTVVVEMVEDVTYLQEVKIMAFPTEEVFKEAVLALNIPMETGVNPQNLNAELLALMMRSTPMDGNLNYRYYIDQYANSVNDKYQPRTNPFLN
ncbi:MAG TPA: carboxypeptidase-like regulatory domain-containing protein, partial [Cyclobacteriaceae bacterium]|nr:carboxypeptidase-like regulatory domain-containing protein [Cyclobacteriaceae bacterium]